MLQADAGVVKSCMIKHQELVLTLPHAVVTLSSYPQPFRLQTSPHMQSVMVRLWFETTIGLEHEVSAIAASRSKALWALTQLFKKGPYLAFETAASARPWQHRYLRTDVPGRLSTTTTLSGACCI